MLTTFHFNLLNHPDSFLKIDIMSHFLSAYFAEADIDTKYFRDIHCISDVNFVKLEGSHACADLCVYVSSGVII